MVKARRKQCVGGKGLKLRSEGLTGRETDRKKRMEYSYNFLYLICQYFSHYKANNSAN